MSTPPWCSSTDSATSLAPCAVEKVRGEIVRTVNRSSRPGARCGYNLDAGRNESFHDCRTDSPGAAGHQGALPGELQIEAHRVLSTGSRWSGCSIARHGVSPRRPRTPPLRAYRTDAAGVTLQIGRRLGLTVSRKVLGRRDSKQLHVGSEAHGYHVFLEALAHAYARVEPTCDDVAETAVDHDIEDHWTATK